MSDETLADLQKIIRTKGALGKLSDYHAITHAFLDLLMRLSPPRFVSRSHNNYVFCQYGADYGFSVTRPLNTDLMFDAPETFDLAFERFMTFLADIAVLNLRCGTWHICCRDCAEKPGDGRQDIDIIAMRSDGRSSFSCRPGPA